MPYLGRSPGSGVRSRFIYAATSGQTSFSGNDSNSVSLAYEDTLYMDVYQNGVLLKPVTDYAATTGTSVVLTTGATTDDVVEMIVYDTFAVADTVSAKDGGTFAGNVAMSGTLGVTGAVTANAGVVVDNITIDGTEIDLSSGDLTIDVAGDITLDADGADIILADGGTTFLEIDKDGNNSRIKNPISDGDIKFQGNDGGSIITALDLDMSDNGAATLSNGLTLTDGDLVVASGHGINFAATSDASGMASELLDDYEEGTFTPAFGEGVTATGYGDQKGAYTKVGRLVTFQIELDATNGTVSTNSGGVRITGLPFATASSGARGGAWFTFNNNFYNVDAGPTAQINTNDTEIRLYRPTGANLLGNSTGLNSANDVHLMGFYFLQLDGVLRGKK